MISLLFILVADAAIQPKAVENVVQKALAEKMDELPGIKEQINGLLVEAYLEKHAGKDYHLIPDSEIQKAYTARPMVRLRHLYLAGRTPLQKKTAHDKARKIESQLKTGSSFEKLVIKYSEDMSARWAGDTDFRGANTLPPMFYAIALKLKPGEVSAPIETEDGVHLLQLVSVLDYPSVPATYRVWLREEVKQARKDELLQKLADASPAATAK